MYGVCRSVTPRKIIIPIRTGTSMCKCKRAEVILVERKKSGADPKLPTGV